MEKFTPLATNFTIPPGLRGWTNFTLTYRVLRIKWGGVQGHKEVRCRPTGSRGVKG